MKSKCTIDRCLVLYNHVASDTALERFVTPQDLSYVAERARREGIEFLTVTLPAMGKALESALRTGTLERIPGFAVVKGSIRPQLFNRAWSVLFSREGELDWSISPTYREMRRDDCSLAVSVIRQLTLMFYKLELPHAPEQCARVIESFVQNEWDLLTHAYTQSEALVKSPLFERAQYVVRMVLGPFLIDRVSPRHGSGASACSTKPWNRYGVPRYSSKLAKVFPYDEWFVSGLNGLDAADWLREEPIDDHLPAKVALVPKDSRGPRFISCEPREHMFIQQGVMSYMYERFMHFVNVRAGLDCTDQTRNRDLVSLASAWQSHASLDLKDASDRVAYWLVEALFPPDWWAALDACRTNSTILPSGKEMYLCKFAPMGSACCFPVEALVFYALAIATVYPSKNSIYKALFCKRSGPVPHLERVSVFGDDIIVPTKHAEGVIETLEAFGMIVNRNKSYTSGPFRESCGADVYDGIDVSIVRVRHLPLATGSRDVIDHAQFRTRDFINNVALKYAIWNSSKGAEVFTDLYQAPVTRPVLDREILDGKPAIGNALIILGPTRTIPDSLKKRNRKGSTQVKMLRERGTNLLIRTGDWSHVLRVFLNGSRDRDLDGPDLQHAGMVSPARRLRYNYSWVTL